MPNPAPLLRAATGIRRLPVAVACLVPALCFGQPAPDTVPPACAAFLGAWSGTWSQGFYGTQRIHVSHVSDQCVATLSYSPTEATPQVAHSIPIQEGVMAFGCSVPGGTCRLEVKDGELRITFTAPSGFVNTGVFRKDR